MREILADLVAEQQALDQLLQRAPDRDWKTKTTATGWTVHDTISHLAWTEEHAKRAVHGDESITTDFASYGSVDAFNQVGVEKGRLLRHQAVIEWWRFARADVVDGLSRLQRGDRIPWVGASLSARTFATARLMETWAHGLDIQRALEREITDTPRLRHVSWLGWATLPWAFAQAGKEYHEPIRVELVGPSYARWIFGPEESEQVVKGLASDWCRVVVNRLDAADAGNLTARGEVAEMALQVARTYI